MHSCVCVPANEALCLCFSKRLVGLHHQDSTDWGSNTETSTPRKKIEPSPPALHHVPLTSRKGLACMAHTPS